MPQVMQAQAAAPQGALPVAYAQAPVADASQRTKKIALGVLIAIIVVLAIVLACLFSCSKKAIAIDSDNFPDETIRNAVTVNLDIDGDGVLSPEEADAVSGIIVTSSGIEFMTDYDGDDAVPNYVRVWNDDSNLSKVGSSNSGSTYSNPEDSFGKFFRMFPNLRCLSVRDLGLTRLDLSALGNLEYLDCLGNAFTTLDLSKNKSLTSMYCDDDVALSGMDAADLYFRDLIVDITTTRSNGSSNAQLEYDYLGRLTALDDKTFAYDEYGRLSRAQNGTSADSWYEEYRYDGDGLLVGASVNQALSYGELPDEFTYAYNDKKQLIGFSRGRGGDTWNAGTIEYSQDKVSSIRYQDGSGNSDTRDMTVTTDSDGRVTRIESNAAASNDTVYSFQYATDGECSEYLSRGDAAPTSNGADELSYSTTYATSGNPLSTLVRCQNAVIPNASFEVSYETNDDGYVTRMTTPRDDAAATMSGTTVSITYVKHVGKLEDLPSRRYVPVYRVENPLTTFKDMLWMFNQDLYSSTGYATNVSILEDGPMQLTFQAIGLAPNVVSNPNEQKLADYVSAHWDEPFALQETVTAAAPNQSAQPAAQQGADDSARTITTDHFTFTMPESWVDKVVMRYEHNSYPDPTGNNGPDQDLNWYFFDLKGVAQGSGLVLGLLVTNDPMGELGQVGILNEFAVGGGLEGYACYGNLFLNENPMSAPNASEILSLISGGQITSVSPSQREAARSAIESWMVQNVISNIKPR